MAAAATMPPPPPMVNFVIDETPAAGKPRRGKASAADSGMSASGFRASSSDILSGSRSSPFRRSKSGSGGGGAALVVGTFGTAPRPSFFVARDGPSGMSAAASGDPALLLLASGSATSPRRNAFVRSLTSSVRFAASIGESTDPAGASTNTLSRRAAAQAVDATAAGSTAALAMLLMGPRITSAVIPRASRELVSVPTRSGLLVTLLPPCKGDDGQAAAASPADERQVTARPRSRSPSAVIGAGPRFADPCARSASPMSPPPAAPAGEPGSGRRGAAIPSSGREMSVLPGRALLPPSEQRAASARPGPGQYLSLSDPSASSRGFSFGTAARSTSPKRTPASPPPAARFDSPNAAGSRPPRHESPSPPQPCAGAFGTPSPNRFLQMSQERRRQLLKLVDF